MAAYAKEGGKEGRWEGGRGLASSSDAGTESSSMAATGGRERGRWREGTVSSSPVSMSRSSSMAGREGARDGWGEVWGRKLEPHGGETLLLMLDRWKKLHKDLFNAKTGTFDLSKVPDVHDNIRWGLPPSLPASLPACLPPPLLNKGDECMFSFLSH